MKCPDCSGPMWDNRPKKKAGEFSPKSPDFKCKDKECGGVIWPDDRAKVQRTDNNATRKKPVEMHDADPYGQHGEVDGPPGDPDWPEVEKPVNGGVNDARKHIMQGANLYVLCVNAVNKYVAAHLPEVAQTSEMFQAATGTLFIEASRAGFVNKMPTSPIK